jgi:hypothetical protein
MAGGVGGLLIYTLLALRAPYTFDVALVNLLFDVSIVALPLGIIMFLFGEKKGSKK